MHGERPPGGPSRPRSRRRRLRHVSFPWSGFRIDLLGVLREQVDGETWHEPDVGLLVDCLPARLPAELRVVAGRRDEGVALFDLHVEDRLDGSSDLRFVRTAVHEEGVGVELFDQSAGLLSQHRIPDDVVHASVLVELVLVVARPALIEVARSRQGDVHRVEANLGGLSCGHRVEATSERLRLRDQHRGGEREAGRRHREGLRSKVRHADSERQGCRGEGGWPTPAERHGRGGPTALHPERHV
mmetsp:Transcript_67057/g.216767  ORF Transcript_67057/g.216767 Transcript_67057/m.216767 type:complete len:243 (+) Transcript_67057:57-785(+)